MRYQSQQVPETCDFLWPEFTLHSDGFNSFVPHLQTTLEIHLQSGGLAAQRLFSMAIVLSSEAMTVAGLAIKVRGSSLGQSINC